MDCPDCLREIWNESAGSPDAPGFCECPAIRPRGTEYNVLPSDDDPEDELEEEV